MRGRGGSFLLLHAAEKLLLAVKVTVHLSESLQKFNFTDNKKPRRGGVFLNV